MLSPELRCAAFWQAVHRGWSAHFSFTLCRAFPTFLLACRQWIGAIELGFVLDELLGVSHRVLRANSGDEVPSLARQIAHHFDTQGEVQLACSRCHVCGLISLGNEQAAWPM